MPLSCGTSFEDSGLQEERTHYLRVIDQLIARTLNEVTDPLARERLVQKLEENTHSQAGVEDEVALLLRALWKTTEDEFFGLSPEKMRRGTWALACDYMLDGRTLQEALLRGQRIFAFLPPQSMAVELCREGNLAVVKHSCYEGEGDPEHFLVEFYTMLWHRFLCWAIDQQIPLSIVRFSHAKPEHHAVCSRLLDSPIEYESESSCFAFSASFLQSQLRRSKPELTSWLKDSPVDVVRVMDDQVSLKGQLRKVLSEQLQEQGALPSYDELCKSLGLGPQTLRRQLKLAGTSYQAIKDELMKNIVAELLKDPRHSLEDVVQSSGYSDGASLTRACKRWFGMTPGQYRLIVETQQA
ncbi:AraC family transcriptional regulator ligand-binding domain-containing protein [Parahaliea sp. F7430]|uniref:AraC family transcriptional regulator ligand-binding domain-containing protein n=1 Tax=Sediminihaliea albiluteola TaxID=2758564 RepID=A0A7W2TVE4_9GAMM|nr:AraC family transcriptional regulator [Sediminihaliea albiluteola]MBA6412677.1 AraC family transcriptional regulator ligand-binding domain-containing protein [Sediminihaliea albiluteola]